MYDRTVQGNELTFCVSGQLWNRSLVMLDVETESLWSHILGRAMEGKMVGERLEPIPADMVTWGAWKRDYPDTSVLALSRTRHRGYTKQFYRSPRRFVVGIVADAPYHCSFATLFKNPVVNNEAGDTPLLVSFDRESTSIRVFSRELENGNVLSFVAKDRMLYDNQTESKWNRVRGTAIDGPLKGTTLKPFVGIVSYAKAWKEFHPNSHELTNSAD